MTPTILITGSTGYVGSRLIRALDGAPCQLICTARNPDYIRATLPEGAIAVAADFSTDMDLSSVFDGVDVAFFLMHSLGEKAGFEDTESTIARRFARAASQSGVRKIVYLGGLVDDSTADLSPHMRSRKMVGDILRDSGIPVIELRASVILGPGSTSFELIRALVERLPIMITPKWVQVKAQPIYIDDVIAYLTRSITLDIDDSIVVEIGGADVVSYRELMAAYAHSRGLRRYMIPVPFLTPTLSSLWLGLVTPVYARVGKKLIDSITSESIVLHPEPATRFGIHPINCASAIQRCLEREDADIRERTWSDSLSSRGPIHDDAHLHYGNRIIDIHRISVPDTLQMPFTPIEEIGGKRGWYFLTILWQIRGFIDLLIGGIGIRRGRTHDSTVAVGDTIDWWRVDHYVPGEHLRLKAEMKLPGRAWLDFELISDNGHRTIQQTVIFDPLGLFGLLYWYLLYPIHWVMFKGMLRRIVAAAR